MVQAPLPLMSAYDLDDDLDDDDLEQRALQDLYLDSFLTGFDGHAGASSAMPAAPPPPPTGASEAVLEALPSVNLTAENVASEPECAICNEDFSVDECVLELGCKHHYHRHCAVDWLSRQASCPVCRWELPADESACCAAHSSAAASPPRPERSQSDSSAHALATPSASAAAAAAAAASASATASASAAMASPLRLVGRRSLSDGVRSLSEGQMRAQPSERTPGHLPFAPPPPPHADNLRFPTSLSQARERAALHLSDAPPRLAAVPHFGSASGGGGGQAAARSSRPARALSDGADRSGGGFAYSRRGGSGLGGGVGGGGWDVGSRWEERLGEWLSGGSSGSGASGSPRSAPRRSLSTLANGTSRLVDTAPNDSPSPRTSSRGRPRASTSDLLASPRRLMAMPAGLLLTPRRHSAPPDPSSAALASADVDKDAAGVAQRLGLMSRLLRGVGQRRAPGTALMSQPRPRIVPGVEMADDGRGGLQSGALHQVSPDPHAPLPLAQHSRASS